MTEPTDSVEPGHESPERETQQPTRLAGVVASVRRHPRALLYSGLALVFVLLGTGAVFAGAAVGASGSASSATRVADVVPSPTPTVTTPPPRPTPDPVPPATALRTCSVSGAAANRALGTFSGTVINTATGEVLFDRGGTTGVAPASVLKTLTAATGLSVLGADYRFSTTVYQGSAPGIVVLVGGGDATLSALPPGQESVYRGAPKISTLADQVKAAWASSHGADDPITSVIADANLWNPADAWDPTWPANERTLGFQPLVTALMVDGDRANPAAQNSPRSTDPIVHAGAVFAEALGLPSSAVTKAGSAVTDRGAQLGQVQSQPLSALIGKMLPDSDNTLAEMVARVSSTASGSDGSAASLTGVYQATLAKAYGLSATGLVVKDGSGESNQDAIPPTMEANFMVQVGAGAKGLKVIYDSLPVSGQTGTLKTRFTGANAAARGAVNAKTGSIATAYALAGIIHAKDGTALAFAFFAEGRLSGASAMAGLDTVTTAVFGCGNNLSNN
ncbi:D-alanyl-D-alanine carboxypeptidase/D-alanyl-D-alanine-endopeptidase [Lacisediminihabitans changchengi]|uniref:D-alanyl-D-alanine carboxypeptidase n=1 Tax=Lacisediminihabitans changchengi TaxID=2787634 RepID=A0A934SNT8_9MICO|nr:D-alanyl-D-alanine carboxypeptidase [Lacisediminihabitans changchengi]MBK4348835.1 D-alanyl-D-alanine carboxypeptidase [Lacisediminihabitans changchengi]